MPACPSCQAEVEPESDLCLSCGEPLGDSPAARLARAEATAPKPSPPTDGRVRSPGSSPAARATLVESPAAKRRRTEAEPAAVRCPGCGVPSTKERCPGCGGVLKRD